MALRWHWWYKGLHLTFSPQVLENLLSHQVLSDSVTPWTAAHQASMSFIILWSLSKFNSIESVMPSNHFILCRLVLLLPPIFPSIRVFSKVLAVCIRWPKYWSFSIRPSNEYSGLISFKNDWLDLLAVQETLKSLFQFESSSFFMVQLSHLYMTTGKSIILTIWTFVSKVTSLLFNTLSNSIITFLPRSNCLLISWLQSPSTVILEPKKRNSITASTSPLSICYEVLGLDVMVLGFFNVEF